MAKQNDEDYTYFGIIDYNYKYSSAELEIKRKCNNEAVWKFCTPLSIVAMSTIAVLDNYGKIKRHPIHGPMPKMVIAASVVYYFGRIGWNHHCYKRMKDVWDSDYGTWLRKQERLKREEKEKLNK